MLSKDIQEAINKNLPSIVAGELKAFIDLASQRATQLENVIKDRDNYIETVRIRDEQIAILRAKERTSKELEELKLNLEQKERNFKLELSEQRAIAAESKSHAIYQLAEIVFRSPTKVTSINEGYSKHIPACASNNYQSYNEQNNYIKHQEEREV